MANPAPRSGTMIKVQFKLPAQLVEKIDRDVAAEIYSTRSEFFRHLVEGYFAEEKTISNLDRIVNERIEEGRYDNAFQERFKKIISEKL